MVDFTSLNTATLETATRFHNFAKNIETAHLGNLYTTVIDGIDYYVVERAAKPLLEKAPEWVYENSVVDSIKNHKGLYILAAGIITLIFINYMLHAKDEVQGSGVRPTSPKSEDDSNLENGDGIDKPTDTNLTKKTSLDSKKEKDPNLKNGDGNDKPTDTNLTKKTSSDSNDKKETNVENADGIGKSKDHTSVNVDDEDGRLEEDSDHENKTDKHKDSENKLKNTVNKNGGLVEHVEAGGKDATINTNISLDKVQTLLVTEEIDLDESKEKEKIHDVSLKTDTKKEDSSSDLEEDTQ